MIPRVIPTSLKPADRLSLFDSVLISYFHILSKFLGVPVEPRSGKWDVSVGSRLVYACLFRAIDWNTVSYTEVYLIIVVIWKNRCKGLEKYAW